MSDPRVSYKRTQGYKPQRLPISDKGKEALKKISDALDTGKDLKTVLTDEFDSNKNNAIDEADDKISLLKEVIYSDLTGVDKDTQIKYYLIRQKLLQALKEGIKPTPKPLNVPPSYDVTKDKLIQNPFVINIPEYEAWSKMRLRHAGETITFDGDKLLQIAQQGLARQRIRADASIGDRAKALVKDFWENDDCSGRHIFRMEELQAVFAYVKSLPDADKQSFKDAFFKEMGEYIGDSKNGLNAQFVLDSLLSLVQTTDWSDPGTHDLRGFIKDLAIGIADNTKEFKDREPGANGVVIGNYDIEGENNIFGALALVKYKQGADTKYEFVEHKTGSPVNKIKYVVPEKLPMPKPATPKVKLEGANNKLDDLVKNNKLLGGQTRKERKDTGTPAVPAFNDNPANKEDVSKNIYFIQDAISELITELNKGNLNPAQTTAVIQKLQELLNKLNTLKSKIEANTVAGLDTDNDDRKALVKEINEAADSIKKAKEEIKS